MSPPGSPLEPDGRAQGNTNAHGQTSLHPEEAARMHLARPDRQGTGGRARSAVEELKRARSLLAAERRTLEMIAHGASLTAILEDLCNAIDAQAPGVTSTVLLMDPDGKRLWPTAGRRSRWAGRR